MAPSRPATKPTPAPVATVGSPAPRSAAPSPLAPTAAPAGNVNGQWTPTIEAGAAATVTASPVAAASTASTGGTSMNTLLQLVVGAALLLGSAGSLGLFLTRRRS